MNKNNIIITCVILVIVLLGIMLFNKVKEIDDNRIDKTEFAHSVLYDEYENLIYDISESKEIEETIENTTIQGIVELNHNGYIYIFNGQHFGEYGLEMKEYTEANIDDKKQECIDYYTSDKYDTSYIQEGDIIICTGDLIRYKYTMGNNDFDTKDNSIIVLKSKDYDSIKKETINNEKSVIATVVDYYNTSGEIYIKYDVSDKEYNLPFALKLNITDDTKIIGNIVKGSKIKVQYKNLNIPLDELELKSIEVINDNEI